MTASQVQKAFGHKLIGTKQMKSVVGRTLLIFPDEIIRFITKNCWIVSSFEDGWAFVLRGGEIRKNEFLIFLSDGLLQEDEAQIRYTLVHEIGHVVLGHRNSITVFKKAVESADELNTDMSSSFRGIPASGGEDVIGKIQSKSEVRMQEKEADEFARKHLNLID